MNAATFGYVEERGEPALGGSMALSFIVHLVLFAAIPAVVAYNRFAGDLNRLATRFDSFMEEFSNILHRQAVR